jgi:hypothetical protein
VTFHKKEGLGSLAGEKTMEETPILLQPDKVEAILGVPQRAIH